MSTGVRPHSKKSHVGNSTDSDILSGAIALHFAKCRIQFRSIFDLILNFLITVPL